MIPETATKTEPKAVPDPEAAQTTTTPATTTTPTNPVSAAFAQITWRDANMLLFFFSLIVLVSSCLQTPLDTSMKKYQVSLGAIGLIVALGTVIADFAGMENVKAKQGIAWFNSLWWIAGVMTLTFAGSFISTAPLSNGYYGTWFAFIFATHALLLVSPMFDNVGDASKLGVRWPIYYLIIASGVVMGAAIPPCTPQVDCYRYNAWAVSLGSISLFMAFVLYFASSSMGGSKLTMVGKFLVLFWAVGSLVVTFGGPFATPGNGYFGSYAALAASVSLYVTACGMEQT